MLASRISRSATASFRRLCLARALPALRLSGPAYHRTHVSAANTPARSISRALSTAATPSTSARTPAEPDHHHSGTGHQVWGFFDRGTATWQYVLADRATSRAAIVDPVLDFDPASGAVATRSADGILAFAAANDLHVERILYAFQVHTVSRPPF
jgi:hypothetical protein